MSYDLSEKLRDLSPETRTVVEIFLQRFSALDSDQKEAHERMFLRLDTLEEGSRALNEKVGIQNGRVKKLEDKWEVINQWLLRTLFTMVIGLVVFIFLRELK